MRQGVIPRYARLSFARSETIQIIESEIGLVDTIWLIHRAEWPLSSRAKLALAWLQERPGERAPACGLFRQRRLDHFLIRRGGAAN